MEPKSDQNIKRIPSRQTAHPTCTTTPQLQYNNNNATTRCKEKDLNAGHQSKILTKFQSRFQTPRTTSTTRAESI